MAGDETQVTASTRSGRLVDIRDLSVSFQMAEHVVEAVRGVSLQIDRGETVALVGESGSGKSVTALAVLQLLPYPKAFHPSGSIKIDGEEAVGGSDEFLQSIRGNKISMIFQEPMTSLNPLHTIEKQIGEVLLLHQGMGQKAARARILELLNMVGIKEPEKRLNSYPHQLSGGQRQRVMIAMALANEPELLIADEATTAVDVTIQAQILDLLEDIQRKTGMAMLIITHELGIVRKLAKRIYVMHQGKFVEEGDTAEVFANPSHEYTRMLIASEPQPRTSTPDPNSPMMLETKELKVWFPIKAGVFRKTIDHVRAVDGVDLAVRQGHTIGVVGESGSGKTTLGMAVLRLNRSEGSIKFGGDEIQGNSFDQMRPYRHEMQIVFQDPFGSLSPRFSVGQIVEEGLSVHYKSLAESERRDMAAQALQEVGLDPANMNRYPHEFSGGQRQRISIARAIVLKPKFIVLDEPTSALDRTVQVQILELLTDLQTRHNLTYMFISHDLKVVRAIADDVIVMREGKVVEYGTCQQVLENPKTDYASALVKAAFDLAADTSGAVNV
ncbi:MAG: ABC transporter ATP-binding protein [Alphaproteobacteria bacterium]|nr:ABC transporter ATP-binding protein [Alphaproteobacteria bacterium]MBT5860996.1 ABC transporter ATP-binding protein [Alphaproteobacteria bacterium]